MESIFFDSAPNGRELVSLFIALFIALGFEFVNGFHDTANAVATVIYTRSLRPSLAVLFSGICNFIGVMISGVAVAYSIVHLFPVEVLAAGTKGFAMVFSVLLGAIVWNLGTWYYGLPASSSHTLIGAIVGVGMASASKSGLSLAQSVHWEQVKQVALALFISPLLGFGAAALMLVALKRLVANEDLYSSPDGDRPPPLWIRAILVVTCGGVSLAHGSNDGQKGMGLVMLILIGLVPASFALNLNTPPERIAALAAQGQAVNQLLTVPGEPPTRESAVARLEKYLRDKSYDPTVLEAYRAVNVQLSETLQRGPLLSLDRAVRWDVRSWSTLIYRSTHELADRHQLTLAPAELEIFASYGRELEGFVEYVSTWVKFAIALALGIGTMVGWKRVCVTVGEKIGRTRMSYAQGVCAQSVAALTILAADRYGLPVSTTHILSSGVAGTMYANSSGLQRNTLFSIAAAWVLTLPASVFLGYLFFSVLRLL